MRGEKVQPHHGGICGDGGFGAGLAPRWRASFATARGRIARSLGSALNVVVFGLCWSFEWHRYDFAVRCNHHGKVREPQLGRIVNNESYAWHFHVSRIRGNGWAPSSMRSDLPLLPTGRIPRSRWRNSCEAFRRAGAYTIPKKGPQLKWGWAGA